MNRLRSLWLLLVSLVVGALFASPAFAQFKNEPFTVVRYVAHGGTGSGETAQSPAALADGDLWAIPAGAVITKAYFVLDTAITGTTNLDVGDDDDPDGYVDGSLSITLATPAMYGWDVKLAGAYLRVQTAGATDAADIYVVPNAKYYAAAGKEVKLDTTTASTAGAGRVVVEGFMLTR
jgi:hypothetical protein